MAEWFKATVLKTVEPQGSVGSNPTPSASCLAAAEGGPRAPRTRRGARVAESGRLLSGWGEKSLRGFESLPLRHVFGWLRAHSSIG